MQAWGRSRTYLRVAVYCLLFQACGAVWVSSRHPSGSAPSMAPAILCRPVAEAQGCGSRFTVRPQTAQHPPVPRHPGFGGPRVALAEAGGRLLEEGAAASPVARWLRHHFGQYRLPLGCLSLRRSRGPVRGLLPAPVQVVPAGGPGVRSRGTSAGPPALQICLWWTAEVCWGGGAPMSGPTDVSSQAGPVRRLHPRAGTVPASRLSLPSTLTSVPSGIICSVHRPI